MANLRISKKIGKKKRKKVKVKRPTISKGDFVNQLRNKLGAQFTETEANEAFRRFKRKK